MNKIVFALLFLPSICWGLVLSDIQTQVRSNIGDSSSDTAKQRVSTTVLNTAINIGQKKIAESTFCIVKSTTITLSVGTTYYTLPSDFYVPIRCIYNGSTVLQEVSIELKDRDDESSWLTFSTSTPTNYYINQENTKIGIYPPASEAKSIELWFSATSTDLSGASDVPFNSVGKFYPYHQLIVYYATGYLLLRDGNNYGLTWLSLYEKELAEMKSNIKLTPNYVPSFGFDTGR